MSGFTDKELALIGQNTRLRRELKDLSEVAAHDIVDFFRAVDGSS